MVSILASHMVTADALAAPGPELERRVALVIGNDSYQHIGRLENARADARSIAQGLADTGFTVTLRLDVTEKAMKEALRTFKAQINGGDVAVVYYSGHGVQLGAANYLLPTDIRGDSEEQVKDEAVPLQRILDDLQEQKAKFSLAIIDACRNNPFKSSGRSIGGRGLAPTTAATGQMVLFSAGAGQQALDRVGPNDKSTNGLFTRVLLKEMNRPGVPVDRVLRNVREEVVKIAKTINHEQVPALYDQALGDFFFRPPSSAAPGATTSTSTPVRLPSDAELEQALWDSIKDSASAAPIEEYLRQYPSGRFVPHARVLMAKLKSAPAPTPPANAGTQIALAPPTTAAPSPAKPLAAPDGNYPKQPVRIIVPFPPGGSSDIIARLLGTRMGELAGQPFVIENRAGAGGTIGSQAAARAAADGYTLLLGTTSTHAVAPALYASPGFNPQSDFAPIALLGDSPMVLVTQPSLQVGTVSELVRLARAQPGRLSYASSGIGGMSHLAAELFRTRTGIDILHVPYRGVAPAMTDLIGDRINLMFVDIQSALPQIRAGKLRTLAIASEFRSPLLPDAPTLAEMGIPEVTASSWLGLFAPAGTPPSVVSRINQLVRQALQSPDLLERMQAVNLTAATQPTPEKLADVLRNDGLKWAAVIRNSSIRAE